VVLAGYGALKNTPSASLMPTSSACSVTQTRTATTWQKDASETRSKRAS